MRTTTIVKGLVLATIFSFSIQSYAQNNGHSFELEIQETTFSKIRAISEQSERNGKYFWLEDFYVDNMKSYNQEILAILAKTPNYTESDIDQVIESVKSKIIADFNLIALEYTKKKEKEIEDGKKSNENNFTSKAAGEPCNNADFETGDFTGWELFAGKVNNQPYGVTNMQATSPGVQHTVWSSGNDPKVPSLPKVFPGGGTYSIQLGDYGTGSKAASMKQTFLVDANSTSYTYSYALVMEDPSGHTLGEKPFFKVNMYDEFGNNISCADYSVIAGPPSQGGDPDFIGFGGSSGIFGIGGGFAGYYLPWRTTFIPLEDYIGQNVTIEFITGDCSQSGHYGYAYIDASCKPFDVERSSDFICAGEPVTLTAPPGAADYVWSTGENGQSIVTTTPGNYTVQVIPVTGPACAANLAVEVVGSLDHPVADFTAEPANICIGESVNLTDASYVQGSSAIDGWYWDTNGDGIVDDSTSSPAPIVFNNPGDYDITLTISNNGCNDSKTLTISVNAGPDPSWTPPGPLCDNGPLLDLNTLVTGTPGGTFSGTGVENNMFDPSVGTQTIKYTVSDATCTWEEEHEITIAPIPEIIFNIPEDICLKADPITLTATPVGGDFTFNGQNVTEFDPQEVGLGTYIIEYTVANPNYPQCYSSVTEEIIVMDGVAIHADIPDYFCFGADNYTISVNPTGGTFSGDLNNDNVLQITSAPKGTYTVNYDYTSPEGCSGQLTHYFQVGPDLKVTYDYEESCFQNITLSARPLVGNFVEYKWYMDDNIHLGDGNLYHGRIDEYGEHKFTVIATDNRGCVTSFSDYDSVTRESDAELFIIPNVITPNGDGINDYIEMPFMEDECINYTVLILNRWGNVVYECSRDNPIFSGKDKGGSKLADGTYFYKVVSDDFDCGSDPFKPLCYGFITIVSR